MVGKFTVMVGYQWSDGVHAKGETLFLEDPATIAQLVTDGRIQPADEATARAIRWNRSTTWTAAPPEDPRWRNVATGKTRVAAARPAAPAGFGPPPWLRPV